MSRAAPAWLVAVTAAVAFTACDNPQATHEHTHDAAFARVGAGQLGATAEQVKQVTSRFNSTVQATKAGYVEASPCVAVPGLGGMGHHYVNFGYVDPVFNPLEPEALLYEPAKNGQHRLIGVEYVVIDVGQPAPTFDGHPFDVGGEPGLTAAGVDHWTLHAWVHEANPSGLHAPFNPNVVCP